MTVQLTPRAQEHIRRVTGAGGSIRLSLHRGGCAGAMYRLEVAAGEPGDVEQAFDSFTLHLAAADVALLDGTIIDCIDDLGGRRIVFSNPRETARCGCGQSVALGS